MGIEDAKTGHWIYHLTKLKNLDSIIDNGLVSRRLLNQEGVSYEDVANPDIISKRTLMGLDNYVPFHFHPYSAFDYAVKQKYCDEDFMYICVNRNLARGNNFKILPMHPLTVEECIIYDYDEGFNLIDWETMTQKGLESEYAKHVKMAECITDLIVPLDCFQAIAVKDAHFKDMVEEKLCGILNRPHVDVRNYWF